MSKVPRSDQRKCLIFLCCPGSSSCLCLLLCCFFSLLRMNCSDFCICPLWTVKLGVFYRLVEGSEGNCESASVQKLFSLEEYLGLCSLCSPVLSRWAWERSFPPNRLTPTMSTSGVTHTIQSTFVRRSQAFTIGRNFLLVCCCILPCCKLFFSFWMHFRDGCRRNQHTPNSHTRTRILVCHHPHKKFFEPKFPIILVVDCVAPWLSALVERKKTQNTHPITTIISYYCC